MVNRYHTFARTASALLTALLFLNNAMYAPDVSAQTGSARRTRRATTKRVPSATQPTAAQKTTQTSQPVQQQQRTILLPPPPPPPRPKPTPTPEPVEIPADDDEIINVVSKLVVVPVSVTDARGEPVRGLTIADFRIEERGRKQEVTAIGDPDDVPLEIALLLDVSGSVRDRFEFERDAATRFLRQVLRSQDRATLFFIDATPRRISDRDTAENSVRKLAAARLSPDQTTAFYDTVVAAAKHLRKDTPARHRRVIVALTDGFDTNSELVRSILTTTREVQGAEAVFYAINPSGNSLWLNEISKKAQSELVQLAAATGGTAFVPTVADELDTVFRRIGAELRTQYLLQYYSNNEAAPGQFLPITVNTPKRQELRVRARQGYYSGTPTSEGGSPEPTNKK
jgi:Ca-activated chloride channel family protein